MVGCAERAGVIVSLTRGTTAFRARIARSAYPDRLPVVADLVRAMALTPDVAMPDLRVDGGATASDLLVRFRPNLLGCAVPCTPARAG